MQSARGQKQLKHHFLTAAKGVAEPLVDTHLLFSGYTTFSFHLGSRYDKANGTYLRPIIGTSLPKPEKNSL